MSGTEEVDSEVMDVAVSVKKTKQLNMMGRRVAVLLDKGDWASVDELIEKFADVLSDFNDKSMKEETREAYEKELYEWTGKVSDLKMAAKANRERAPSQILATAPEPRVPKRAPLNHDGEVATFRAFWLRFEKQVAGLGENEKMEHLYASVAAKDVPRLEGKSFDKAELLLKESYQSMAAMLGLFTKKFGQLRMRSQVDVEQLQKLKEAMSEVLPIAEAGAQTDPLVLGSLFDAVYQRLPREVQFLAMHECGGKDAAKLGKFLDQLAKERLTHNLSSGEPYQPEGGKRDVKKDRNREDEDDKPKCFFCKEPGHMAKDCEKLKKTACDDCGVKGHTKKYCKAPNKKSDQYSSMSNACWRKRQEPEKKEVEVACAAAVASVDEESRPLCEIKIGEKVTQSLADTGSKRTVFSRKYVPTEAPWKSFGMADGKSLMWTQGPQEVEFEMDGIPCKHPVYVHDADFNILGVDLLKEYGAVISVGDRTVKFSKRPPKESSEGERPKQPEPRRKDESKEATEDKCQRMVREEFSDLMNGIGKTDLVEHRLDTGEHEPIAVPNRRMAVHLMGEMAAHLGSLLKEDVIEESDSEWSSPLVPVRKKDGDLRAAVDFRELNAICKKNAFPMPRIDEVLEALGAAKLFSRLDLRKGYYQIMLREEDRKKTAFAFKGKLYHFKRMPFGLTSAPQTFQRLMKKILGDLPFVVCYLDDVLIF